MDSGAGQEPDPVAIDRVRRDLAELGTDAASAPDVPPSVTARVGAALRAASQPAHAARRPLSLLQRAGLIVGIFAAVAGIVGGGLMLMRDPGTPTWPAGPTAKSITVSHPSPGFPLSDPQLVALLSRSPDFGPLAAPQQRASCLDGLGYSATTQILGAQRVDMSGRPAVLMLLPGETPGTVVALVVEPGCSSAHTGLLADRLITRP
jgi:hypothetical protein